MAKKTGVPIKKNRFGDKIVKADFRKIFTALGKTAVNIAVGDHPNTIKDSLSLIDAFKLTKDNTDLAYQLVLTALVNTAYNLTEENSHLFHVPLMEVEKLYDDEKYLQFLDGITKIIEEREYILEYEMLKKPRSILLLTPFETYFHKYLILFGTTEKDAELITNRLPTYFVFELNNEWAKNYDEYAPLLKELNAPTAEAARKERQWEAYNTYLELEVEKPVFGESFSLKDIFVPLRAYYIKKKKSNREEDYKPVVIPLEESLNQWLLSTKSQEYIKVIQGGPGSGKSSFTKWWIAKLAKERKIDLFYFPLHHFNIHTTIKEAVGEFFKDNDHIPLDFNPLEDTKEVDKMLLVFDGLDELVMQGKTAKEAANAFMQELKDFCRIKNEGKQRFWVLVTGRPIAIQDAETKLRENQQILYLLPYFLTEEQKGIYEDTHSLLAKDQRHDWWNKFFALKELPHHNLPAALSNDNMDKITTEPLLNYLVALSWHKTKKNFNQDTIINDIYYQLIIRIYERDYEKNTRYRGLGDLKRDEFVQILEEIAICAWQGGDARVTTVRKIEKHIQERGLQDLLVEYKTSAKSGVSRLLTAFYFRKFGKEDTEEKDDTFEFTHKSFGEYLAARAIVELIKNTYEEREENKQNTKTRRKRGWSIQDTLLEWLKITGKNAINYDLYTLVQNEIKSRAKQGEKIEQWQGTLCEIINELLHTGVPLHLLPQRRNHLEELNLARNTETALLTVLSTCAYVTNKISNIDWSIVPFTMWLSRLTSSYQSRKQTILKRLNHINLQGNSLIGINYMYADLNSSKLEDADMKFINFFKANLRKANLRKAILKKANLSEVNLIEADLRQTNLIEADLSKAKLNGADLSEANLTGADLSGADLSEANLREANLSGADLSGANFWRADLKETNLTKANLNKIQYINFDSLISIFSLFQARGIPNDIKKRLQKEKPKLFKKPDS